MRPRRLPVGVLAGLVLIGCSSSVVPITPEGQPSVDPGAAVQAAEVVDAFVALMANPEVTYRVESELKMGIDAQGHAGLTIAGRYDVQAHDYAGSTSATAVMLEEPATDLYVVAVDGVTHVWEPISNTSTSVDVADAGDRPNALADIEEADLVFMGRTESGLFEFDVRAWLVADPISSWSALRGLGDADVRATSTESHQTRLLLDANGVPGQLSSLWTFSTEGDSAVAQGSVAHRFAAFGLYVAIPENVEIAALMGTSHDIVVGVDETQTFILEPWFDVGPGADDPSAELEVTVEYPEDQPVMLGIEGAILFVSAHDEDGLLALDAVVPFEGGVVDGPAGRQTVEAYYRSCDGNCSILDPPKTFCRTAATLDAGARYNLRVVVRSADPVAADCILTRDA